MGQEQATLKDMISGIKEKFEEDVFSSELFHVDFVNKQAVCPNGKEMIYLGDAFETSSGPHMRFRGYLRKIIDSDDGKQMYSRRMHTIDEQLLLHCLHSLRPVA